MAIILRRLAFTIVAYFLLALVFNDVDAVGKCSRKLSIPEDWMEYRKDEFIFQYTLDGKHALPQVAPVSRGVIPSRVLDISTQLRTIQKALAGLGYQHPLDSPRYRSQGATHILVRILHIERAAGLAFDELRRLPSGECVLILHIRNNLAPTNLTPAHEYFHLVQYGYTPFKRSWFLEGMARWSETILGARNARTGSIPMQQDDLREFFSSSYSAGQVWKRLIKEYAREVPGVHFPAEMTSLRYTSGEPVIEDELIPGHVFMRRTLEALSELGHRISRREGRHPYLWPEKLQRSAKYDQEMWQTITKN